MNKRRLHHFWTKFRALKPWYFLVATLIFGVIAIFAFRANNQHMADLRDKVYAADKSGQGVDVALNNLRKYIYAHMNTSPSSGTSIYPPIQLQHTYDRLVAAESAKVSATNAQLYTEAQTYCQQLNSTDFSGRNRVPCVTDYVNTHGAKSQPVPDALYKFDFASPAWSPDLAGWSLLLAVISLLCCIILFIINRWFQENVT